MPGSKLSFIQMALSLFLCCLLQSCSNPGLFGNSQSEVVIYVSIDQIYAEPVLQQFETESGIRVKAVYDVEAAKTTGLVNRLLAEKDQPLADVYWSGEFAQTILLKEEGVLSPYTSPQAASIPDGFKDADGYWTGFGGRARIILVNTDLLTPEEYPDSIEDLLSPNYPASQVGLAYPLFGTTATHAAALYAVLGADEARAYFQELAVRGVGVVDGNSVVKDRVSNGEWLFGLTDTDDACQAIQRGEPVTLVFPDQQPGGLGTLVIPNTVALVAGGPNPERGQALIDNLLSPAVESELVNAGWIQFPLRPVDIPPVCGAGIETHFMQVNFSQVYHQISLAQKELGDLFVR